MINSPGLILLVFSAALTLLGKLTTLSRKKAARQNLEHVFLFFITTFPAAENGDPFPLGALPECLLPSCPETRRRSIRNDLILAISKRADCTPSTWKAEKT